MPKEAVNLPPSPSLGRSDVRLKGWDGEDMDGAVNAAGGEEDVFSG